MTLFQLAANGDADTVTLARRMGLTLDATQNSATTKASPEQVLGGTIMLEIRYRIARVKYVRFLIEKRPQRMRRLTKGSLKCVVGVATMKLLPFYGKIGYNLSVKRTYLKLKASFC